MEISRRSSEEIIESCARRRRVARSSEENSPSDDWVDSGLSELSGGCDIAIGWWAVRASSAG